MSRIFFLLIYFTTFSFHTAAQSETNKTADQLVESVTIYRDSFGVPHVYGETDEAAAFGFAYAQAEDNFWQIEDNFIRAAGRASEIYGSKTMVDDWLNKVLRIEELSKYEYEVSDEKVKALCRGYTDGLNYYVDKNSIKTRLIEKFEPWHTLAFIRYLYYQRGFVFSRNNGLTRKDVNEAFKFFTGINPDESFSYLNAETDRVMEGSNSWAVNGKKSASGNPLLFINPHLPFFGPSQVYEGHIMSKSGWNFSGYTRFGFTLPYVGFNENLGWASTDNYADQVDIYSEAINFAADYPNYKYGDSELKLEIEKSAIDVLTPDGMKKIEFKIYRTHHGPLAGIRDKEFLSLKMAKFEEPGWLAEWHGMTKAENLNEFKDAVSKLDMLFGNYLYADRDGNIFYVYNGCVPMRDTSFVWTKPVDGSSSSV